jgi:hypothetical protein
MPGPRSLPLVPRCELKYSRVPSGLNAGPAILLLSWPISCRNGAAMRSPAAQAVEAARVVVVFGEVDDAGGGVHRHHLVPEGAHRRAQRALARLLRVELPDLAARHLLARARRAAPRATRGRMPKVLM